MKKKIIITTLSAVTGALAGYLYYHYFGSTGG